MQGKLGLAVGFAAGYVFGSKAGRERYEQIIAASRRLMSNETVQGTAGMLQAQATGLVDKAKHSDLVEKAMHSDLVEKARHTVRGDRPADQDQTRPTVVVGETSGPSSAANGMAPDN